MRKVMKNWQVIAMSMMVLFATSCEKNEGDDPAPSDVFGGKGNILIETTVKNADGASGQSYLQQVSDLSGTLNMSKAIQIGFSSTISVEGNDVYVFPETGSTGKQCITKYEHTPEGLKNAGELQIVPNSCPYSLIQVSADKAYIPTFNLGNIMIVDTKTMTKTGEIDLTKYAHADNSPEPACGIVRDGILYLALDQLGSNWMPYDDYRQVDVALIDIKSDKVLKIISEKKSEFALPTRPFLKNMIFMDEQNDIYMACLGYFGYNPQHPNNGFVCIPNGKQEFDESKSWNINETAIEGSPYKAASIYNCKYLGNGKIAAYVGISELMTDNPYTARNSMAVIIDLKKKSIKKIEGIPYTDGHSVAIESKGNDVLFASCGVDASGVFDYNVETGKVSQVLSTSANVAFMHFFD